MKIADPHHANVDRRQHIANVAAILINGGHSVYPWHGMAGHQSDWIVGNGFGLVFADDGSFAISVNAPDSADRSAIRGLMTWLAFLIGGMLVEDPSSSLEGNFPPFSALCSCGRASTIHWMGLGYCSDHHFQVDLHNRAQLTDGSEVL